MRSFTRLFFAIAVARTRLFRGRDIRQLSYGQRAQYVELVSMLGHNIHRFSKWMGSVLTWTKRANHLEWDEVRLSSRGGDRPKFEYRI